MKKIVPEYSFSAEQLNSISALANCVGLTEQITRILYARGVDTEEKIRRFMRPSKQNFLSPFCIGNFWKLLHSIKNTIKCQ
jgi:hypothetical protein